MINYNADYKTDEEIKRFVENCDKKFVSQVEDIVDDILNCKNVRYILLTGPTCSGKTSATNVIISKLKKANKDVLAVSIDDFYKNEEDQLIIDGKPNYETIEAIDFEYFKECIDKIEAYKNVYMPVFDFVAKKRKSLYKFTPKENTIIIFEGIQVICPEITALFQTDEVKKIFISVSDDVNAHGSVFTKRELRFARRLVRDSKFRGTNAERTFELWQSVTDNEDKNIYPFSNNVDYTINSFLEYDINVLRDFVIELLLEIEKDSKYYDEAQRIIDKYKLVKSISTKYVPKDSFFREFIGEDK